jgi:hypothetical protein
MSIKGGIMAGGWPYVFEIRDVGHGQWIGIYELQVSQSLGCCGGDFSIICAGAFSLSLYLLFLISLLVLSSTSLASTYLLSRITVVHHAALNCIRRIFAIIVTSIVFGVPITFVGALGICISFGGFMSFTYAKATKKSSSQATLLPLTSAAAAAAATAESSNSNHHRA